MNVDPKNPGLVPRSVPRVGTPGKGIAYGWMKLDKNVFRKLQVFRLGVGSGKVID
jgi:hypothetical protein